MYHGFDVWGSEVVREIGLWYVNCLLHLGGPFLININSRTPHSHNFWLVGTINQITLSHGIFRCPGYTNMSSLGFVMCADGDKSIWNLWVVYFHTKGRGVFWSFKTRYNKKIPVRKFGTECRNKFGMLLCMLALKSRKFEYASANTHACSASRLARVLSLDHP